MAARRTSAGALASEVCVYGAEQGTHNAAQRQEEASSCW